MKQELQADQQSLEVRAASIMPSHAVYGQWGLWCTQKSNFIEDYFSMFASSQPVGLFVKCNILWTTTQGLCSSYKKVHRISVTGFGLI
jgi:hypothetical protein